MATDEERENFIESFWMRRDPTPDSMENEYKEEHYRRIAYANDRYASGIPGWRTDRGRIYIAYGPPDEIESHPSGGQYQRPYEEGGGFTSTYPFEIWRYRWIEGIGSDILLEFVDPTMTGEYRLTMDPSEKDALLHVPGAGLTLSEQMGLTTKADRFRRTDGTRMGTPIGGAQSIRYNQFERLQLYANIFKPPAVKFKDLEAIVNSTIDYDTLAYEVDIHYVRVTNSSVLSGITVLLRNEDLMFKEEDGLHKAVANVFGRIHDDDAAGAVDLRGHGQHPDDRGAHAPGGGPLVDLQQVGAPGSGNVPSRARGEGSRRGDDGHLPHGHARSRVRR